MPRHHIDLNFPPSHLDLNFSLDLDHVSNAYIVTRQRLDFISDQYNAARFHLAQLSTQYDLTRSRLDFLSNQYNATRSRLDVLSHQYFASRFMGLEYYREPIMDFGTQEIELEQPEANYVTRQPILDLVLDLPGFSSNDNNGSLDLSDGLGMSDMGGDGEYESWGMEIEVEEERFRGYEEDYGLASDSDNDPNYIPTSDEDRGISQDFELEEAGSTYYHPDVYGPVPNEEEEIERQLVNVTGSGAAYQYYVNYTYSEDMIHRALNQEDEVVGELLFEGEDARIGKPPASEKVLQGLGTVVVSKEDLEKGNVSCAVCKDDMNVGEVARELPCRHRYHNDCIFPWLKIRNTCPVCRYELETDDPDYENRRVAGGAN